MESNNVYKLYNSLNQLVKDIESSQVNEFYKKLGDLEKDSVQYKQAVDVMLTGDPESARLIKEGERTARLKSNSETARNTTYSAQQGFIPNMGRVMSGHPENMINVRRQVCKNTKVVNIIYNCTVDWRVKKKDIAYQGARLLTEIKQLEKNGYRVNLYVANIAYYDNTKNNAVFAVKVKDDGKPVNITRLAFPLVNDMFLRKIMFALIECSNVNSVGYGLPLIKEKARNVLKSSDRRFAGFYYIDYYTLRDDNRQVYEILKENVI